MSSTTDKLADCLEDAEKLIAASSSTNDQDAALALEHVTEDYKKLSPLKKLASIFSRNSYLSAEPIRIIQHMSCTGGTLFGKCVAAMPNTVLFSEMNPLSTQLFMSGGSPVFCPTDVISLARIGKAPAIEDLSEKVFLGEIRVVEKHLRNYGQRLVLREHTHSSFLVGNESNHKKTIPQILDGVSQLVSIVTVRHPLDSFLSLRHNGWIHFDPGTFDEYCRRYLLFLHSTGDAPVFKYEDLLENPEEVIQQICDYFEIPFNPDFLDYLEIVAATGDSGRSSIHIGKRERRPLDEALHAEVQASSNFRKLCELLGYDDACEATIRKEA